MTLWRIENFTSGPHWDMAIVEADTTEAAKDVLAAYLASDHDEDTVWEDSVLPRERWIVQPGGTPFLFVLGSGCR